MESVKEMKELLLFYRTAGEEKQVANLAHKLGDIYRERGNREEALPLLEESLALCRKHKNAAGEAVVALCLAELHLEQDDPGRAEELAKSALAFHREQQDSKGKAKASLLVGDTHWAREEYEAAIPYYEETLDTCRAHQDTMGAASLLDRLAKMHRHLGRHERSLAYFRESLACWQKLSIPDREAMTWANLGDLCKSRGDLPGAIRCHEQALTLYQFLKNPKAVQALQEELQSLRGMQKNVVADRKGRDAEAD